MSKTLAVEYSLRAKDLPMGGPWACSCSPSDRDPTAKSEPDLLEQMAKINCLLVDFAIYDEVNEAIASLDCTEYEDGEHMGYARVYPMARGNSTRPEYSDQIDRTGSIEILCR